MKSNNTLRNYKVSRPLFLIAALFLSSLFPLPLFAQQQDDDDVVRVNSDLVLLNITVVDENGKFVHGLKRSDFKVFEDGKEQTIISFGDEVTPFAAAVLLDASGSMEERLTMARGAAVRFLDGLRSDDSASVYRFDTKVEQLQEFSSSRDLPPLAFEIRAKGMTVLNDAILRAANDLALRTEKRRAIVVLSDGADTASKASEGKALDRALAAGATIYAVDMSATPERGPASRDAQATGALKNFSSKSGGRYVGTPGGPSMREAFASIAEELGNQYTIAYRPTNRAHDGRWRAIEIKLSRTQLNARTRKGYRAQKQ